MDQTTINELAKAIAAYLSQQGFSLPLSAYLWIVLLALVSGAIGSFFGSLLKETGKSLAERLHFDRLLKQLRASEQVKTGAEAEEWKRREWSTLRRQKLEELVTKLQEASSHLSDMQWTAYAGKMLKVEGSIERANMIVTLYFPEMYEHFAKCADPYRRVIDSYFELSLAVRRAMEEKDPDLQRIRFEDACAAMEEKRAKPFELFEWGRFAFECAASELMADISGIDDPKDRERRKRIKNAGATMYAAGASPKQEGLG